MAIFPDLVGLKKITGSYTESALGAGATVRRTITLDSNVLIVGVPAVSTSTANADVVLVSGGSNGYSFVVDITNNGAAAQDVVVDYTVYVIEGA